FFQILTRAATKGRRRPGDTQRRSIPPSQRSRPLSSEPEETDQERIRKFLEALGQPTTSKPPPPVAPRPTYQKPVVLSRPESEPVRRRTVLSPLPPLTTRPPEPEPVWRLPRETPAFEVQQGPPQAAPVPEVR